jgi:predicted hydrocarbon binding protein
MEQIPKSGYYFTNKSARNILEAYEEVLGKKSLNNLLNLAGLSNLIDNYPPDNLERQFDFADFATIHIGLEEIYSPRVGRGLALRAGRVTFNDALKDFGALAGIGKLEFKVLPLQAKIRTSLSAAVKTFSDFTDQISSLNETDDTFIWTIQRCPICWTRKGADEPVCYISVGMLQAMLNWVSGGFEFRITESKCCATGDTVCEFVIQKVPIS